MLNNNVDLILKLAERHKDYHQNYCKNHPPLFFASFFQSNMLKCIANLYLRHMDLLLQLIIDD